MKSRVAKLLAMALCVAMALSLVCVPAMGAAPMMGETAVAEAVPENVGAMPAVSTGHPTVEADEPGRLAEATPYSHNFDTDGTSDPDGFYAITSAKTGNTAHSWNGIEFAKGVKLESSTKISFTTKAKGKITIVLGGGGSKFKLDDKSYATASPFTMDIEAGDHTVTKDSTNVLIYYIEWGPSHTHQFGDWTVDKEATCTAEGSRSHVCSAAGCDLPGGKETEVIEKKPHTVVNVPEVPAKCTVAGKTAGTKCSVCDTILSGCEVIPANGQHAFNGSGVCTVCGMKQHTEHTWDAGVVTTPATCDTAGVKTFTCTIENCGETKTEVIEKLGHDLEHHEAKAATCTEKGWDAYDVCKRGCGYTTYKEIPAGHKDENKDNICDVCHEEMGKPLTNAGGWFETLYAVIPGVKDADVTKVTYSGTMNGKLTGEDFKYLVRDTAEGVRVDIPGIPAGTYTLKITAGGTVYEANNIEVMEHDRSGYAHYKYTEGIGAYRDDGLLKENAIVLYVTNENKDDVYVESADGTGVTGIGHILNTAGKDVGGGVTDKGGKANNNAGIMKKLAEDGTPVVVRIIGRVEKPDGATVYNSTDYGGSVGDNGGMVRMKDARNITIEGIGSDAVMDGWGIHFMAGSGYQEGGKSFEVRNISFQNVPEDCVGMEGVQSGSTLTASVERCWVHNCTFHAPHIADPAESDKDGGDGACDFKRGQYMTLDYCYFDGYHKTSLLGAKDANLQFHITWHHNYWKTCDSRGPLGRQSNVHIYNCIYDGQTSYCQNTRANCYIFSEYNTFLNCKAPRQVDSGAIKSYNDSLSSCINDGGATTVTDKNQKVSSGNTYENFDTNPDICYIPSGDYKLDTDHATAKANIMAYCGPMKAQIIKPEDINGSTVVTERVPKTALSLPYDKDINNTVATAASGTFDNIVFANVSPSSSNVKYGKDSVGQYVVFKVDERVDVTLDGTASVLVNEAGNTVADIPGSATNLPAGIYYIQPASIQPAKNDNPMTYKEGTLTHLTVVPTKDTTPPHEHSFTNWKQTVAPTCTRTGTEQATCSCGETRSREIAKIDHVYVGGVCQWCDVPDGTFNADPDAPDVAVTDLALSESEVNVLQGNSVSVVATVLPENATDRLVTWTSSDETVAKVSNRGVITGKGPGTATITATTSNNISKTVTVKVIGVQATTYTFSAPEASTAAGSNPQTEADPPVTDGSKHGTDSYFTSTGKNTWKAENFNGGKKNTVALLLGGAQAGGLEFTVSPDCADAEVVVTFRSTGNSNRSAIGLLDASGNLVNNNEGTRVRVCLGKTNATVNFKLTPGTYKLVVPTGILPEEVNPDWEAFPNPGNANDPDDPNKRGTQLVHVRVVEYKTTGEEIVPTASVELDRTAIDMETGKSFTLHATVKPDNSTFKKVEWTSSNTSVATVATGVVRAWAAGTATITASCGGKSATCTVTVTAVEEDPIKVERITITGEDTVEVGSTLALVASVEPREADNKILNWTSSNTEIATVSKGVVTGVAPGTVTITAAATDGSGVKDTLTVTVEDVHHHADTLGEHAEYTWSVTASGKLTMSGTGAVTGDSFYAATWDKDGKFLGVKIIDATAQSLTAQLNSSWAHLKLIWTNAQEAPKCEAAETNK